MKTIAKTLLSIGLVIIFGTAGSSDIEVFNITQTFTALMRAILILIASYITYFIGIAME